MNTNNFDHARNNGQRNHFRQEDGEYIVDNERPKKRARVEPYDSDKENEFTAPASSSTPIVSDEDEASASNSSDDNASEEPSDSRSILGEYPAFHTPPSVSPSQQLNFVGLRDDHFSDELNATACTPFEHSVAHTPPPVNPRQQLPSFDVGASCEEVVPNTAGHPPVGAPIFDDVNDNITIPRLSSFDLQDMVAKLDDDRQLIENEVRHCGERWIRTYRLCTSKMNARSLANNILQPSDIFGNEKEASLYETFKMLLDSATTQANQVAVANENVDIAKCRLKEAKSELRRVQSQVEVAEHDLNEAFSHMEDAERKARAAKRTMIHILFP
ncbi:hypothetical protein BGZ68_010293 [Mortierella alpina]|nr:hypothetical protein BGZ68_010293 [Mortierella alpina]